MEWNSFSPAIQNTIHVNRGGIHVVIVEQQAAVGMMRTASMVSTVVVKIISFFGTKSSSATHAIFARRISSQ